MKKLYPVSLGCPKNKVDFEKLLALLLKRGFQITLDPEVADVFWINTCAFIKPALQESIDHILELGNLKKTYQKLIVSGCLTARYRDINLKELFPEVDEFYDIEPYKYFSENEPVERVLTETPFYAYLKITEGCSHSCSYCTIPQIRGPFRSKPLELLLSEAQNLIKIGIRELILVGQDITLYGKDLGMKEGLVFLLEKLSFLDIPRIRLLYLHPANLSLSLIRNLLGNPKVLPYFDLPIQHAHPEILKKMRRPYGPEKILNLIEEIRSLNPLACVRTTVMVGFPGETEKEFVFLLEFLQKVKFDYLGVFTFYPEEGTTGIKLPFQVPYKEKLRRKREVLKLQREISKERLFQRIGTLDEVLILGEKTSKSFYGISKFQAPQIDGLTYVKAKKNFFIPGEIVKVKIKKTSFYDLWAEAL
ncbi:MAG: 30S ribosomal protein S12 methylthiotransferase RimO [Thermodesulfobacteriaceae bacterium]|nr:30S ribosomal protein S12 methylthiotransferase RimO [Thermodesulfobacteriaceae bacterium]